MRIAITHQAGPIVEIKIPNRHSFSIQLFFHLYSIQNRMMVNVVVTSNPRAVTVNNFT
jgi:hypothetical protein